jgi:hypothetical protein
MSALVYGDRTTTDQVSFSNLAFDNAIVNDATNYVIPLQAPTTGTQYTVRFPAGATNLSVTGTGGVSLTSVPTLVPGAGNLVIFDTDGTAGTFGFASLNTFALTLGESGGLRTLTYFSHGEDTGLNAHGFTIEAILPGDWRVPGTSTGHHEFLGVASGFTITQNFVFDSKTNTTIVEATNPNYPSKGSVDGLNFVLYGAQVPETNLMPILALGFGVIGLTLARRRASGIFRA